MSIGLNYYFQFITLERIYYFQVIQGKFGNKVALTSSFDYILSGQYKNHSTV